MSLKIGDILERIVEDESAGGPVFVDYAPVYILDEPTPVKFKLSENPDQEITGTIQSSPQDHEKIAKGASLSVYTFELVFEGNKETIQISGEEVNNAINKGAPTLLKNQPYNIITGKNLTKPDEGGGNQSVNSSGGNFYNGGDIDEVNSELKDIKLNSEPFKIISKYNDDEEFRRIFLDSFINSTKAIKINQKPIMDTLKDLRKNGLLEEPGMSGRKREYLKIKLGLQKYMNNLFKLFAKLHKNGKQSQTYQVIKKFYKQLFFIVSKGVSNVSDDKTRSKLWKQLIGNFSDLLKDISNASEFTKGKPQYKNESIIKEAEDKKQIIFTDFNITDEAIENSFSEFAEDNGLDNDGNLDDVELDPEMIQKAGFHLYGKDVGRLFPNLSLKFKDIKTLFGLLGKGGYQSRLDKSKDDWNVGSISFAGDQSVSRTMKNLPKLNIKFETELKYQDKEGNKLNIKKGMVLPFSYDQKNKVIIHKVSKKMYSNINQIYLKMDQKPEEGKQYNSRLIKIIPASGRAFDIETQKGYDVKISIPKSGEEK